MRTLFSMLLVMFLSAAPAQARDGDPICTIKGTVVSASPLTVTLQLKAGQEEPETVTYQQLEIEVQEMTPRVSREEAVKFCGKHLPATRSFVLKDAAAKVPAVGSVIEAEASELWNDGSLYIAVAPEAAAAN